MTLDEAIAEWKSRRRRRPGCVTATNFLCRRVPGFSPLRFTRYTPEGDVTEHVVAYDGQIVVDLVPENDGWEDDAGQIHLFPRQRGR